MKVVLYGLAFEVEVSGGMPGYREGSVGGTPNDPPTVDVTGIEIDDEDEFWLWLLDAKLQKGQTVLERIEEEVANGN